MQAVQMERAMHAPSWHFPAYTVEAVTRPSWGDEATITLSGGIPVVGGGTVVQYAGDGGGVATMNPKEEGYKLGQALAQVIGVGASDNFGALTVLAMWFAKREGYRELDSGSQYMQGFVQGFQSVTQPGGGSVKSISDSSRDA